MIGLLLKLAQGIYSPLGNSPYGFTIIARGIPDSFAYWAVLGIRSVVILNNDLSVL